MSTLKELELAKQELQDAEQRWKKGDEKSAGQHQREIEAARERVRRLEKALQESGDGPGRNRSRKGRHRRL